MALILLIISILELLVIFYLVYDRWKKIQVISERRRDIRILKRALANERRK